MKGIFKYFNYSIVCSIAYCIPVFFLFENERYKNVWLLYLGNFCFAALLVISNVVLSSKTKTPRTLATMLVPAIKMEVGSVVICCAELLLLSFIFKTSDIVKYAPANILGFYYMLFLSAILINMAIGSFCVYLWAITGQQSLK